MPAWITPELWPVWCVPSSGSRSSTQTSVRAARRELARHGEADDAAADDGEVAALAGAIAHRGWIGTRRRPALAATAPGPPGAVAAAASSRPAP